MSTSVRPAEREILWLRRVRDLSHLLVTEHDVRKLLPLILDAAVELTDAERGFLVRVQGRKPDGGFKFKIEVARGFDKASLQGSQGKVSRTVVRRVVDAHMDVREVAVDLGIPEGTVKSRMHHARKQIARSCQEAGIDWEDLS